MKIKQLFKGFEVEIRGSKEVEITGISTDSRTTSPGHLFIAKKGTRLDGAQFIERAVGAGSPAILTDLYDPFLKVTQMISSNPAALEARLAARFYQEPSKELFVAGVTGTKGKTTTTYLIKHLLDGLKLPCGLIGTVETIIGESRIDSTLTTHPAALNQKLLREMVTKGCRAAALEVSSHGLVQGRGEEVKIDIAVFTNLHPDHLDYHKTVEEYAAAKKRLFCQAPISIFNADSPWSDYMAKGVARKKTFGIETAADLQAKNIRFTRNSTELDLLYQGRRVPAQFLLLGRFNVYNFLAAALVGVERGAKLEEILSILSTFKAVPGRLEEVKNGRGISLFVDYAHTGESLENVLKTLKEIAERRLIVVFGCGGGRDPRRRVEMARSAEKWADLSIVTSDNPRNEDPNEIARQILSGFEDPGKASLELERKKAIAMAIRLAQPQDIVLIAGKGHEKVQIFAHQTVHFDDVEAAKEALAISGPF